MQFGRHGFQPSFSVFLPDIGDLSIFSPLIPSLNDVGGTTNEVVY